MVDKLNSNNHIISVNKPKIGSWFSFCHRGHRNKLDLNFG